MSAPNVTFPALLQEFFQRRLVAERGMSAHTIASYRDSFELLLRYAEQRTGRTASALTLQDLDAPMILSFLDQLKTERRCGARTRNLRLTAIRSFMRYASVRDPTSLPVAQRVLAIAGKRFDRPVLGFLSRDEMQALLDAPDRATWSGQRDAALFAVLYNTGARVSEVIRLRVADVLLDRAHAGVITPPGQTTAWNYWILALAAYQNYNDNPGVPYDAIGALGYNSNGYIRGLLEVTGGQSSVPIDTSHGFVAGSVVVPPGNFQ